MPFHFRQHKSQVSCCHLKNRYYIVFFVLSDDFHYILIWMLFCIFSYRNSIRMFEVRIHPIGNIIILN